jgi:hypothetical protein
MAQVAVAIHNISFEDFFVDLQTSCLLSIGQSKLCVRIYSKCEESITTPDCIKISSLFSDNQINSGKILNTPARLLPNPKITSSAGMAQQISVAELANRLKNDKLLFILLLS